MASRAHAVKVIQNILDKQVLEKPVPHKELAKIILDTMEFEVKMLPPLVWMESFNKFDSGWENDNGNKHTY
jgi:hypothetical protein